MRGATQVLSWGDMIHFMPLKQLSGICEMSGRQWKLGDPVKGRSSGQTGQEGG